MKYFVWITCLACVCISPSARAQSRFSIAPTYSLVYSYLSNEFKSAGPDGYSTTRTYGPGYGSAVGLTGRYHFTPKFDVSVGLLHNRMNNYYQIDQLMAIGFTPMRGQQTTTSSFSDNFQFPVLLNFRSATNRLSPYFSAGALFNYQLGQHNQLTDKNAIQTSLQIGAGVSYRINKNLSLVGQPFGSYRLKNHTYLPQPANLDQHIKSYQIGLQTQLIYHF